MPTYLEPADMLSPAIVEGLWLWTLQQLGLPAIHAPSADQFVAAYLQRPEALQYPYPRYGLEVHFPDQEGRPHRVDLTWERLAPPHLRRAAEIWQSPLVHPPGLQVTSGYQLEEMDFEDHQIKRMGVFNQVSKQMPLARYQGPTLQRIADLCGTPDMVGSVANRAPATSVLLFPVADRSQWQELIGILTPEVGEWLWAWSGLFDLFSSDIELFRLALLCDANGGVLPRLGVEFSVNHPTPQLLQGLHQLGLSSAALDAWAKLADRLPVTEAIHHTIAGLPLLTFPSHAHWVRLAHSKLILQAGQASLKTYVMVRCEPIELSQFLPLVKNNGHPVEDANAFLFCAEVARRSVPNPLSPHPDQAWQDMLLEIPAQAQDLPFRALAWPQVRQRWNRLLGELPEGCLARVDVAAQDSLLAQGMQRLISQLGASWNACWLDALSGAEAGQTAGWLEDLGLLGGQTEDERSHEMLWCRQMMREGMLGWAMRYPEAALRLPLVLDDWARHCRQLRTRLATSSGT